MAERRPARPRRTGSPRAAGTRTRRPAPTRRTTAQTAPRQRPKRRAGLTTRATVLGLLLCAMVLLLTVPLRQYFSQRSRVERIEAELARQERAVAELQEQRRST